METSEWTWKHHTDPDIGTQFQKMKIKFTKNDFTDNGGKLFLNYLDILNQWESDSVGKWLTTMTEKLLSY